MIVVVTKTTGPGFHLTQRNSDYILEIGAVAVILGHIVSRFFVRLRPPTHVHPISPAETRYCTNVYGRTFDPVPYDHGFWRYTEWLESIFHQHGEYNVLYDGRLTYMSILSYRRYTRFRPRYVLYAEKVLYDVLSALGFTGIKDFALYVERPLFREGDAGMACDWLADLLIDTWKFPQTENCLCVEGDQLCVY